MSKGKGEKRKDLLSLLSLLAISFFTVHVILSLEYSKPTLDALAVLLALRIFCFAFRESLV